MKLINEHYWEDDANNEFTEPDADVSPYDIILYDCSKDDDDLEDTATSFDEYQKYNDNLKESKKMKKKIKLNEGILRQIIRNTLMESFYPDANVGLNDYLDKEDSSDVKDGWVEVNAYYEDENGNEYEEQIEVDVPIYGHREEDYDDEGRCSVFCPDEDEPYKYEDVEKNIPKVNKQNHQLIDFEVIDYSY